MVFRRSIFTVRPIRRGETFTEDNIRVIRPGYGMKPQYYKEIIGKHASRDIDYGMPLSEDLILEE
uniref:SAF domain-containing protein n=1 Tax=Lachnoclostridium phocaeense TaxID=1871021 RepID=UPI0026DC6C7A|nr:SAF domain-containing protein [Lachnoclostridium phocaeense]